MPTENKKREKFDYKATDPPPVDHELQREIKESELQWWLHSFPKKDIKALLIQAGHFRKISSRDLNVLLWHSCSIFMHWKRKPTSQASALTPESWDKLRMTVDSMKSYLIGRSLNQSCQIIRSKISTNEAQLSGLPARMRYWEHQT